MSGPGPLRATARGVRLDVRVVPRSPRTGIDGVRNGRLLLRVTAPPVDGAANAAVVAALAGLLGVSKQSVRLVSGVSGRNKVIEVDGVDTTTVTRQLFMT